MVDPDSDFVAGGEPSPHAQSDWSPDAKVGRYRLVKRIGAGSTGEVWLAAQSEPVRRDVAIKVVKQGMNSEEVVARFEAERQALALLDHPSIAQVFDAGVTPNGRPYFVMQYVDGLPITEYCDAERLTLDARLDLFVALCEGVQYAHFRAIVHRDLKPSNVLVTLKGESPQPRIIDFGLAKAMTTKLTNHTMQTEVGALLGTPEYMSPEQIELEGRDIDTRVDVYSLGMIL